jgi:4-aminobutyrate aminotransferase
MSAHLADVWLRATDLDVVEGSGCTIRTADGTEYLDFTSGIAVTSTGHCHRRVVDAIRDQAARIVHAQVSCYRHDLLEPLATRLASVTPPAIDRFFFANSGAEAVEGAVKLARYATGRPNVVVMEGGFHGRTYLAMAMTTSRVSVRAKYQPLPAGIFVTPFPRPHEWGLADGAAVARAVSGLEMLFATQTPPEEVAAILIEPVLGEGGYLPAPAPFLRVLREVCDAYGIALVADEVQTGFGRTGLWFAVEHASVAPDVLVMGKGIASGFPFAAIGARRELMDRWSAGAHGSTYGGNPVGCAAALATMEVIADEHLVENAAARGRQLLDGLRRLQATQRGIADVRGLGLMVAAELRRPDGSADAARARAVIARCLDHHHLVLLTCGPFSNVVRFVPPLVVTEHEIDRCLAAFADAVAATA